MVWECAYCGNWNSSDSEVCSQCGAEREESNLETTQQMEEDEEE